ncbi:MAG: PQQ-dependent sugar dehydrogenase [Phyllobacteriaceae bacterium]|nr:PQQ-dependent sugar dehydrogenase [Phyllobacteriaceae bacterium]
MWLVALMVFLLAADARAGAAEKTTAGAIPIVAETMAAGLDHPWGMDFLPDGAVVITERAGAMRLLDNGVVSPPLAGVPPVFAEGQGGLLDVAVAPDFAVSRRIAFTFAEAGDGGAGTALARATLDRKAGRLDDVEVIFRVARKSRGGVHFGSRIVFAPDGTLFVTLGERGDRYRAQDFSDHAGGVIRLNPDGSIPPGNPFADGSNGRPELWSKGHRNPQGAAWDPVTKALLTVEHGAQGGDEVNRPEAGKNYGWPVITYGKDYSGATIGEGTHKPGYEQPLWHWDPSIAPSGLAVYDGPMFPEWRGDLLVGALKFRLLSRLDRDAAGRIVGEERAFADQFGRIRNVDVAPDGSIWLLTDEDDGRAIRLSRGR